MLFHSPAFIFFFLPTAVVGFFVCGKFGGVNVALVWLIATSLFFYGWWNPAYLWLIGLSIAVNYALGRELAKPAQWRGFFLAFGIAGNLAILGYFKYANFFLDSLTAVTDMQWSLGRIILPLGISFFTFEQIAWLVETSRGETKHIDFLRYAAFVTNFPKLIAGPIIRPHELLPQLEDRSFFQFKMEHLSVGLTIFSIGLFKKVVLADRMVGLVGPVFHAAALGTSVTFSEAWGATIAYTLQLYFDFSGYTDMALGTARMFGLVLPLNFHSPYKSLSIAEFWRRWHMSLSRLIRDYVYIPLGGSRRGHVRQHGNLLATMLLVGLWHGAGWTFVLWGGLHGGYLIINHAWSRVRSMLGWNGGQWWSRTLAWATTFTAVVIGWVFFRAESTRSAISMLGSMVGLAGVSLPGMLQTNLDMLASWGVTFDLEHVLILTPSEWMAGMPWVFLMLGIALLLPNTQQFMRKFHPAYDYDGERMSPRVGQSFVWRPTARSAFGISALTTVAMISLMLSQQSEFLYFQF